MSWRSVWPPVQQVWPWLVRSRVRLVRRPVLGAGVRLGSGMLEVN